MDCGVQYAFGRAAPLAAEAFGTVRVEWDQVGGASMVAFGGMQAA